MINKLTITNYLGQKIVLDVLNYERSYTIENDNKGTEIKKPFPGFIVAGIQGIEPVEADINFADITTNDGGIFNSARISTRDISLTLIYSNDLPIETIRHETYKYFPTKKEITLEIETDTRKAKITGYVKSNGVSIFTQMEGSSIVIQCPDPYFESTDSDDIIDIDFSGILPKFVFAFPDASPVAPNLIFGDIESIREKVVEYNGDAETGLVITIHALGDVGSITFYNRIDQREQITIDATKIEALTGSGIISGDTITISTLRGNKTVTLLRNGEKINILNCIGKNTNWMQIKKGDNVFAFSATSGQENAAVNVSASTIYEGM